MGIAAVTGLKLGKDISHWDEKGKEIRQGQNPYLECGSIAGQTGCTMQVVVFIAKNCFSKISTMFALTLQVLPLVGVLLTGAALLYATVLVDKNYDIIRKAQIQYLPLLDILPKSVSKKSQQLARFVVKHMGLIARLASYTALFILNYQGQVSTVAFTLIGMGLTKLVKGRYLPQKINLVVEKCFWFLIEALCIFTPISIVTKCISVIGLLTALPGPMSKSITFTIDKFMKLLYMPMLNMENDYLPINPIHSLEDMQDKTPLIKDFSEEELWSMVKTAGDRDRFLKRYEINPAYVTTPPIDIDALPSDPNPTDTLRRIFNQSFPEGDNQTNTLLQTKVKDSNRLEEFAGDAPAKIRAKALEELEKLFRTYTDGQGNGTTKNLVSVRKALQKIAYWLDKQGKITQQDVIARMAITVGGHCLSGQLDRLEGIIYGDMLHEVLINKSNDEATFEKKAKAAIDGISSTLADQIYLKAMRSGMVPKKISEDTHTHEFYAGLLNAGGYYRPLASFEGDGVFLLQAMTPMHINRDDISMRSIDYLIRVLGFTAVTKYLAKRIENDFSSEISEKFQGAVIKNGDPSLIAPICSRICARMLGYIRPSKIPRAF